MDQKTSILINRQVPEYVREEYPLFLTFLEAYYEFLENKQGNENNDLTTKLKTLKSVTDVDESIDEFESQFLSTFASLVPVDANVDKSFLIKNVLPLYQSKGSENSFKFLFRMLFSEEPEVKYPRDNILRASAGKWNIDTTVKVSTNDISSFYTSNGVNTEFKLITSDSSDNLEVFVNNTLQTSGFKVLKEYQLLEFDSAVANNAIVEVFYPSVDKDLFKNRQIIGVNSEASVLVEKVFSTIINNESVFELYVDSNSLVGEFEIGEQIETQIFIEDILVDVRLRTISKVRNITIIDSGSNYNVGDPVIVISPGAAREPKAIVSSIYTSTFNSVDIFDGGAGFKVGANVTADGFGSPFVDIEVNSIFTTSSNSANSFRLFSDIITDIDPANTTIDDLSYGLSGPLSGNVNSVISHCFSNTSISNFGEIIGLQINSVIINFNSVPVIDVEPASVVIPAINSTVSNTTVFINSYGSLGKTNIINGGENYAVGDELVFTNQPGYFGFGAEAEVREVDANGSITLVQFVPSKITGTANVFTSNTRVIGTGTSFQSQLRVGDNLWINGEDKDIVSIESDTSLNVNSSFASSTNGKTIRLYGKNPVGGAGYEQTSLPSVSITSNSGANALIDVVAIFGDGENLQAVLGNNKPGGIETITIIDAGKSLLSIPEVDLSSYGDGLATAEISLIPSVESLPGKWLNSEGLISDRNMKLQGLDYYIDYSYVTISSIEFKKYKNVFKQLLHPGGTKAYAEMASLDIITTTPANVVSQITQESV